MQKYIPSDDVTINYKGHTICHLDLSPDDGEDSVPQKTEPRFNLFEDIVDLFDGYTEQIGSAATREKAFDVCNSANSELSHWVLGMELFVLNVSDRQPLPASFLVRMVDLYCYNCDHKSSSFTIWCAAAIDACYNYVVNCEEKNDIRLKAIVAFRNFVTAVFALHLN